MRGGEEAIQSAYHKLPRRVRRDQISQFRKANLNVLDARQQLSQLQDVRLPLQRITISNNFQDRVLLPRVGDGRNELGHPDQRRVAHAVHPDGRAPVAEAVGQLEVVRLGDAPRDDEVHRQRPGRHAVVPVKRQHSPPSGAAPPQLARPIHFLIEHHHAPQRVVVFLTEIANRSAYLSPAERKSGTHLYS